MMLYTIHCSTVWTELRLATLLVDPLGQRLPCQDGEVGPQEVVGKGFPILCGKQHSAACLEATVRNITLKSFCSLQAIFSLWNLSLIVSFSELTGN